MMQFNELVKGKKAHVLEAPITGGLEALKKGQMTVFMAGEKDLAEQVISICFIIFLIYIHIIIMFLLFKIVLYPAILFFFLVASINEGVLSDNYIHRRVRNCHVCISILIYFLLSVLI